MKLQYSESRLIPVAPRQCRKGIANLCWRFPSTRAPFPSGSNRRAKAQYRHRCLSGRVKRGSFDTGRSGNETCRRMGQNVAWRWEGDVLKVESLGKAAHGSAPFNGDSAATRLFRFLVMFAPSSDEKFYRELLYSSHPSGAGIGIHGRDEVSKDLTCNLGCRYRSGADNTSL